jgi:hypothetical protein
MEVMVLPQLAWMMGDWTSVRLSEASPAEKAALAWAALAWAALSQAALVHS